MLGFSEREVGHLTLLKFYQLFEHYKKFYNFKMKNGLFKIEEENTEEWLKD